MLSHSSSFSRRSLVLQLSQARVRSTSLSVLCRKITRTNTLSTYSRGYVRSMYCKTERHLVSFTLCSLKLRHGHHLSPVLLSTFCASAFKKHKTEFQGVVKFKVFCITCMTFELFEATDLVPLHSTSLDRSGQKTNGTVSEHDGSY